MKVVSLVLLGLASCVATATSTISTEEALLKVSQTPNASDAGEYLQSLIDTLNQEEKDDQDQADLRADTSTFSNSSIGCDESGHQATIDFLRDSILSLHNGVGSQTSEMGTISDDTIPALRTEVENLHEPINDAEMALDTANKKRDDDKALYMEQRGEILDAIAQLEDIRQQVVTSVSANRAEPSSNNDVAAFLESRAEVSRGLKAKLMRTAARALLSGAVDNIFEIFYKMRNEFKNQLATADEQEAESVDSWERSRQNMRSAIGDQLIALEKAKKLISDQHTEMAAIEAQIALDNIELAEQRKVLNNAQMTLEEAQRLCQVESDNLKSRMSHRAALIQDLTTLKDELLPAFVDSASWKVGAAALGSLEPIPEDNSGVGNTPELLAAAGVGIVPRSVSDVPDAGETSPDGGAWRTDDEKVEDIQ